MKVKFYNECTECGCDIEIGVCHLGINTDQSVGMVAVQTYHLHQKFVYGAGKCFACQDRKGKDK